MRSCSLSDMVKHELRVTSYELKMQKRQLKFKSASSNPQIIKSIKTQVNSLNFLFS